MKKENISVKKSLEDVITELKKELEVSRKQQLTLNRNPSVRTELPAKSTD